MIDEQFAIYNAMDSLVTYDASLPIWFELEDQGYLHTYEQTAQLLDPLIYMATRGMLVDQEELQATRTELRQRLDALQLELNQMTGRDFNYNSPKQCKEFFYIEKGLPAFTKSVKTPEGRQQRITCDDKALQRLAAGTQQRPPIKEAKIIQELRGLNKLIGTYLDIKFDEDSRLRCSMNPRGTKFGRISTSKTIKGTGMNMQNLPQAFRSFIKADPGCLLIELDKAKAEWVVVAYLSKDGNMIHAVEQKLDVHAATARMMYDLPLDLIAEEDEAIGHTSDSIEIGRIRRDCFPQILDNPRGLPRTMSIRQAGKKSNHGLNYDEGAGTFALTNEITQTEAKHLIDLYHSGYPGIRKVFHAGVAAALRSDRVLYNCFGRKYKFYGRLDHDLLKQAYAFNPQSTVADLLNRGLIGIYYDRSENMRGVELLNQVHDSAVLQWLDIRDVQGLARCLVKCQKHLNPTLTAGGRDFTIDTDLKIGLSWGDMKKVSLCDDEEIMEQRLEKAIHDLGIDKAS